MAPVGIVGTLGWLSTPEVGIFSLIAFFILSITLLALCVRCNRASNNAYDVNGTTQTDGAGGANGNTDTRAGGTIDPGAAAASSWRNHNDMPPSTLERPKALTN